MAYKKEPKKERSTNVFNRPTWPHETNDKMFIHIIETIIIIRIIVIVNLNLKS